MRNERLMYFIEYDTKRMNFCNDGVTYEILDRSIRGNKVWFLAQRTAGGVTTRYIILGLYTKGYYGDTYGSKLLDDGCGFYHWGCPKKLINRCTAPVNEYARMWREQELAK